MNILIALFLNVIIISLSWAVPLPRWEIIPTESSITFSATQNNAPLTGEFKSFTGTISADPQKYQDSQILITVKTDSVSVSYAEVATLLLTPEWFDVKKFPPAELKANEFKKIDAATYEAKGTLTIKDKIMPVKVLFNTQELSPEHWVVTGSLPIKRSEFSVGTGEWVETDSVKDLVTINFKLAVKRK